MAYSHRKGPFRPFNQLEDEVEVYERLKRGDWGEIDKPDGVGQRFVALRTAFRLSQRKGAAPLVANEPQVSRAERTRYQRIALEQASGTLDALAATPRSALHKLFRMGAQR